MSLQPKFSLLIVLEKVAVTELIKYSTASALSNFDGSSTGCNERNVQIK